MEKLLKKEFDKSNVIETYSLNVNNIIIEINIVNDSNIKYLKFIVKLYLGVNIMSKTIVVLYAIFQVCLVMV